MSHIFEKKRNILDLAPIPADIVTVNDFAQSDHMDADRLVKDALTNTVENDSEERCEKSAPHALQIFIWLSKS